MFNIGTQELLVILFVVLILFGAKRIPEVSRSLGKGLADFRDALSGVEREIRGETPVQRPGTPPGSAPIVPFPSRPSLTASTNPSGPSGATPAPAPVPPPPPPEDGSSVSEASPRPIPRGTEAAGAEPAPSNPLPAVPISREEEQAIEAARRLPPPARPAG